MCLHNQTVQPKKRCPAILARVKIFHRSLQRRFYEQCTDLAPQIRHQSALYFLEQGSSHSFIQLEDHIPHKCFTDDDICRAVWDISRLHAADKIDIRACLEKREGLLHKGISLLLLRADIHDTDSRILLSHDALHIN